MRTKLSVLIASAALLAAAAPVLAHHSFAAEFDAKKPVKLQGTVTKMEWINPHAWIYLDVKGTDGTVTNWMVEAGAPNALLRRGWTKASLLPGTEILVEGYQAKDGANRPTAATSRSRTARSSSSVRPAPARPKSAKNRSRVHTRLAFPNGTPQAGLGTSRLSFERVDFP